MNDIDIANQLWGHHRPDHWMHHKKWWWAIFIWGIGVAQVNAYKIDAYKIYVTMWEEENKKGKMDLPVKWMHGEFIEQLVYDMIFPRQTEVHRDLLLRDKDDDDETAIIDKSLLSCGSSNLQAEDDREWDFSCQEGINTFLKNNGERKVTTGGMNGAYISHLFDGKFHSSVLALAHMQCQYCYYIWNNEYNDKQRRDFGYREQNRHKTVCCLVAKLTCVLIA